jgi:hypothetical protein
MMMMVTFVHATNALACASVIYRSAPLCLAATFDVGTTETFGFCVDRLHYMSVFLLIIFASI